MVFYLYIFNKGRPFYTGLTVALNLSCIQVMLKQPKNELKDINAMMKMGLDDKYMVKSFTKLNKMSKNDAITCGVLLFQKFNYTPHPFEPSDLCV